MKKTNNWSDPEKKQKAFDLILNQIENGKSLREILHKDRDQSILPSRGLFNKWIKDDFDLKEKYSTSMELRADLLFDEIIEIADDTTGDTYITAEGKEKTDHENIQRSRLRIDARKWKLSKMLPKKYGDKQFIEQQGEGITSIPIAAWINKNTIGSKKDSD